MRNELPLVLLAALAACTTSTPAAENPHSIDPAQEHYEAIGQEPGWRFVIHGGRMDYTGNYGDTRIAVPRPDPRPSFKGRRYVTQRLTVDLTYTRCNDAMSGRGYEHQVMVTADGETYKGCGGARRTDWDN